MKYLGIIFFLVFLSSCVHSSNMKAIAKAKEEKSRLLDFYTTGEIANIFGKKLNDVRIREEFFSGQNDFDTNQWIKKHLSKEIQYYERRIEDDWDRYLRSNLPSQLRKQIMVHKIGEDFRLLHEMMVKDWKKTHETKYSQGLPL